MLGPDYDLLSSPEKRIERKRAIGFLIFSGIFIILCLSVYAISFCWGSTLKISKEQARVFGGIVAGVIPVFLVALSIESFPRRSHHPYRSSKVAADDGGSVSSEERERTSVTPLQLLFCLFGEIFALSSVLSPNTVQVCLAAFAIAFLLFLFGVRLNEDVFALIRPGASKTSTFVGFFSFLLFMLIFFGYLARISRITVSG